MLNKKPTFNNLLEVIQHTHQRLLTQASKAINVSLTLRNWLFGFYIHTYEQKGSDRAAYGDRLLASLAERLEKKNVPRSSERELRRYRQFYFTYPQIRESLPPEFKNLKIPQIGKRESVTPEFNLPGKLLLERIPFTSFAGQCVNLS